MAAYYADRLTDMHKVFDKMYSEDAVAIEKCHSHLKDPSIEVNLTYIQSDYGFLSANITLLESSFSFLSEAISNR